VTSASPVGVLLEFKSFVVQLWAWLNLGLRSPACVSRNASREASRKESRASSRHRLRLTSPAGGVGGQRAVVLLTTTKSGRELLIRTAQLALRPEGDEQES
jgi:hypothetical protein